MRAFGKSQLALFYPSNTLKPTDPYLLIPHSLAPLCPKVVMSWHNGSVGNGEDAASIHGRRVLEGEGNATQTGAEMNGGFYQRGETLVCKKREKAQRPEYQKEPNSTY